MFLLDIRTLSVVTMLFSLIFFIGIQTYAKHNRRFYGLLYFAFGDLLLFTAFLLMSLRDLIPDYLSIVAANAILSLGFFLFTLGGYSFLKRFVRLLWLHITGLIIFIGLFVYFTHFSPDFNIRVIIISAFVLIECGVSAFIFFHDGQKGYRRQKYSMACGFLALSLYCIFRIIWTVLEVPVDDSLQAGLIYGLMILLIQILIVNTAFSLFWITNSILNEDLEDRAKLDPLTRVLNRRAFIDEMMKELARSKRESLTFSLLMADLDHFKSINDNHGHLAGDSVLIGFTSLVQENLRINDILCRFGGEEFLILLPNTEKKQAVETAERIRRILENSRHPFNGKEIQYTVSFGVTSFDMDAQNKEELLENVDIALYEAKSKGRNRVESK